MRIEAYYPLRRFEANAKSIAAFRRRHKDAVIEAVDDRSVLAMCESCSLPIFEGERRNIDTEGVTWHKRCPKDSP